MTKPPLYGLFRRLRGKRNWERRQRAFAFPKAGAQRAWEYALTTTDSAYQYSLRKVPS